jgi:hypothetical protein
MLTKNAQEAIVGIALAQRDDGHKDSHFRQLISLSSTCPQIFFDRFIEMIGLSIKTLRAGCGNRRRMISLGGSVMSVSYLLRQKRETHKFFSSGISMMDGGCGSKEHAGSYHPKNVGEVTGRVIFRRRQII